MEQPKEIDCNYVKMETPKEKAEWCIENNKTFLYINTDEKYARLIVDGVDISRNCGSCDIHIESGQKPKVVITLN